ncbi:LRC14 protein, partial [Vireo altiloquus]|nr:LRC14 protein [Vireo altiloquus]
CRLCVPPVIQAVVTQLQQDLEEPGWNSSRCRLRVLDITGLPDEMSVRHCTKALAKACVEVSKLQREFQCRRSKRHKGTSGAAMA